MGRESLDEVKKKLENEEKFLSRVRNTLDHGRSPQDQEEYDSMREAISAKETWSVGPITRIDPDKEYDDLVGDKTSSYAGDIRKVDKDELEEVVSDKLRNSNKYELGVLSENPDAPTDQGGVNTEGVSDEYANNDEYMDLTGDGELVTNENGKITGKGAQSHKSSEGI
jgi:hypothetical protein